MVSLDLTNSVLDALQVLERTHLNLSTVSSDWGKLGVGQEVREHRR